MKIRIPFFASVGTTLLVACAGSSTGSAPIAASDASANQGATASSGSGSSSGSASGGSASASGGSGGASGGSTSASGGSGSSGSASSSGSSDAGSLGSSNAGSLGSSDAGRLGSGDAGPPNGICGSVDPNLTGKEPTLPTAVCQTLTANKSTPDEAILDTTTIQAALTACQGKGPVKLTVGGAMNAFIAGPLTVTSETLWIDSGVTLYASRNAPLYNKGGLPCGAEGVNQDVAATSGKHCVPLITASGINPGIVGDGVIDGQGGEPILGNASNHSWWDLSVLLRPVQGSAPNPALIETAAGTTGFVMYKVTLHNSPKFHLIFGGSGFTVWGVTVLTPSTLKNSLGAALSPYTARNTDALDPGTSDGATNGIIACNTISTGDDDICLKGGGTGISRLVIAHNRIGTGHGMSIGSGVVGGVDNIQIYDMTIDGDSRSTGGAPASDVNGLRIKSDPSRGGLVNNVTYSNICVRDVDNPIIFSPHYSALTGTLIPFYTNITVKQFHYESGTHPSGPAVIPALTLEGYDATHVTTGVFDNVVVDGIATSNIVTQFENITAGPGGVNFGLSGDDAGGVGTPTPFQCVWPTLPVAK